MSPAQALSLAIVLTEWELSEPALPAPPPAWLKELAAAREALAELHRQFSPVGTRLEGVGCTYSGPRVGHRGQLPPRG